MKLGFLLIVFSQTILYPQIKIDNNVSIEFPGKTEFSEEIVKGFSTRVYTHYNPDDGFFAMRLEGISTPLPLPENEFELERMYHTLSIDAVKNLDNKGFTKSSERIITLRDYIAYQIEFKDELDNKKNAECLILFVEQVAYIFIYSKVSSFNDNRKEAFFYSINVPENLPQLKTQRFTYATVFKIWLVTLTSILAIILTRQYIKRKKRKPAANRVQDKLL